MHRTKAMLAGGFLLIAALAGGYFLTNGAGSQTSINGAKSQKTSTSDPSSYPTIGGKKMSVEF